MSSLGFLVDDVPIPALVPVRMRIDRPRVDDPVADLGRKLTEGGFVGRIRAGERIGITAGSRGITGLPELIRELVRKVRAAGADPFVFPAMGSHGGATAEGQFELLGRMGITESFVEAPIRSSMETVFVGQSAKGFPVYMDRYAWESDGVIAINRIKPHTSFRGPIESGVVKMLVIGMGKQRGAEACHCLGFPLMSENVREMAEVVLKSGKLRFGVGLVENAFHELARVEPIAPDELLAREPALLDEARSLLPRIPFDDVDVVILDEIGKDISGTGFDTNALGRYHSIVFAGPPRVTRLVVLRLSKKTGGNANGLGMADVTTRKVFERFSFDETYPNALTSTASVSVKIPMVMDSDRLAIQAAIKMCLVPKMEDVRLLRLRSTAAMDEMWVSAPLARIARDMPQLELLKSADAADPMVFDAAGNFSELS